MDSSERQPFFIGANIPWREYGADFVDQINGLSSGFNLDFWKNRGLWKVADAKGNIARFWMFGDGKCWTYTGTREQPKLHYKDGKCMEIENFNFMLDQAANSRNMKVIPVLLDFLTVAPAKTGGGRTYPELISDETISQQFIDNVVMPLVGSCRGRKEILAWEVINEPEWIFDLDYENRLTKSQVQRFVARVAAAIHTADPDAKVTVGGANLKWNYEGLGTGAYEGLGTFGEYRELVWSDKNLRDAVKDLRQDIQDKAKIDIIQVHFYGDGDCDSWRRNMCQDPLYDGDTRQASSEYPKHPFFGQPVLGNDPGFCGKPVIIGECQPNIGADGGYAAEALAWRALSQGYAGILFWSVDLWNTHYDGKGTWGDMRNAIYQVGSQGKTITKPENGKLQALSSSSNAWVARSRM